MKTEIKKLLTIADKILEEYINDTAEDLIDKNPDEYYLETTDYGYYHNGVGFASCGGGEDVYDKKRAWEDAIEIIQRETDNSSEDFYYTFAENKEFVEILNKIINSYRKGKTYGF